MTDHVIWWWTRITIIVKIFDIDIIIDTLCERFLSCSVVRRLKTKRLTRLSVYVERKNVCKCSLVYLQVGSYFKAFCWPNLFRTFCRVSFFYSGTVTREVKRGKRDFHDGATGRNAWKERGIKGFTLFYTPPCPTFSGPALRENVNEILSSLLIFQSSEMFISA